MLAKELLSSTLWLFVFDAEFCVIVGTVFPTARQMLFSGTAGVTDNHRLIALWRVKVVRLPLVSVFTLELLTAVITSNELLVFLLIQRL